MAVEIQPPSVVSCPPHYWLIVHLGFRHDFWTCQRCGTEQDHPETLKLGHRWSDPRTSHHTGNPVTAQAAE